MSKVDEIKKLVKRLSIQELQEFRRWFAEHDASHWDRELETDVAMGRLGAVADEAKSERGRESSGNF